MDDVTAQALGDQTVPGRGTVHAPHDAVAGNGHSKERPPTGIGPALRTRPLRAAVIAVLLAVVAGGLGWHLNASTSARVYNSQTVVAMDDPYGMATAGDEGLLLKLVTLRVKYQGLASTDAMAAPVAAKLGLPVSDVLAGTSVTLPQDSLLLVVTGTSTNPVEAQRLSSALAAEITTYVKNENVQYAIPGAEQFSIATVDPTTPATASTTSHKSAADAVGLAVAVLILGFVVAQLIFNRRLLSA